MCTLNKKKLREAFAPITSSARVGEGRLRIDPTERSFSPQSKMRAASTGDTCLGPTIRRTRERVYLQGTRMGSYDS